MGPRGIRFPRAQTPFPPTLSFNPYINTIKQKGIWRCYKPVQSITMKGRFIQLKEAHQHDESEATCSILWDWSAKRILTAGADSRILIHSLSSSQPTVLRHHKDAVTALALNSNSKCLASGSLDHSVKLYSYPEGEFQSNVTRFTLPIRSLAFNKSGGLLAAAGDGEGIRMINAVDSSIARVLKGHGEPVTSLGFDPWEEYLASADSGGSVILWNISTGEPVHTLAKIAPKTGPLQISWRPNGEVLAVPGRKNEIAMYDRDTGQKVFSLRAGHEGAICCLSWSPNGRYLATSGADCQVLIWDVDSRQDIDRQRLDHRICGLAWKPHGNALALIDVLGRFGVWESAVPSHMKPPADDEEPLADSGSLDGLIGAESDDDEMGRLPRRKARKKASSFTEEVDSRKKESKSCSDPSSLNPSMQMQEAFQSGATPGQPGKRNFLAYNMLGSVITFENENAGFCHIEVDFHDTGRGFRVPSMTDYFGFSMASLSETGGVFASPQKGEKNPSTLMYRPFSSWANNSEWSMRFPIEEEVKAVALGSGWVAAVTNLNFLRIFSEGGLQKFVLCLDGPVVTAAGHENFLAVVTHASNPLASGEQVLNFTVFNVLDKTRNLTGRLPLSPGYHLSWLGFSEEGLLSSYDSKGILRVFTEDYGGCWIPLFSAVRERKSESESFWMVGLNSTQVFCVICKLPDAYPQVSPKPVLSVLNLSLPLVHSDLGADDLENEYLRSSILFSQAQRKMEHTAACGQQRNLEEDNISKVEAAIDRCLLRLIASCCKADKLVRATELARLLSLDKSLNGAIKLVSAMKLPVLAERFNSMLEEKMFRETVEATDCDKSNSVVSHEINHIDKSIYPGMNGVTQKMNPSDDPASYLHLKTNHCSALESNHDTRIEVEISEAITKTPDSVLNESRNNVNVPQNTSAQKPINPFAKAPNASANQVGQGKSSLLNSIKEMKNSTKNEGKRKERTGSGRLPKQAKIL